MHHEINGFDVHVESPMLTFRGMPGWNVTYMPHRISPAGSSHYLTNRKRIIGKTGHESSSSFLVPYLLTVLNIRPSALTTGVSNSIIALDCLAKRVDCVIDSNPLTNLGNLSYESFEGLEERITSCFQYTADTKCSERLLQETFEAVKVSLHLNTAQRGQVYNLEDIELTTCTTHYLIPLVKYLTSLSERSVEVTRLFFLIANYVQILDDYVDLFKDIDANVTTPVTLRWFELHNDRAIGTRDDLVFDGLTADVHKCLLRYFAEIKKESRRLNTQLDGKFFVSWEKFHVQWPSVPKPWSIQQYRDYLNKIQRITPPFLCYS